MKLSGDIVSLLKLPAKVMFAIALASGLVLFFSDHIIQKMYMVSFRNKYGFTIGIVFCISLSITVVSFLAFIYNFCVNQYYKKMFIKKAPERLRKLSPYQKAILYGLFMEDNHTESLPYNDGAVFLNTMVTYFVHLMWLWPVIWILSNFCILCNHGW